MVIILPLFSTLWWPWVYPLRQRTTMVIIQNTQWWATVVWRMTTTKWWPPKMTTMNDDHHDQKSQPRKKHAKNRHQMSKQQQWSIPKRKNAALSIYQRKSWWCPNLLTNAANKMFGMLRVRMTPIKWKAGPRTPKRQRSDFFCCSFLRFSCAGAKKMCRMRWTEIGEHKIGH